MPITRGHSFLVHPGKHKENPPNIGGVQLQHHGKLFTMLRGLFDGAHRECDIEIEFRPDSDGEQNNDCRTLLLSYLTRPQIDVGRKIAQRLQSVTTLRPGLGLLFVLAGSGADGARLVVARFPADEGVVAREKSHGLSLEFFERVFMKSSKSYKCALYRCSSPSAGFWEGTAVDRQIDKEHELSQYWIDGFLDSELRTTGPAGTKRLAVALKGAIKNCTDGTLREELWSAAKLMRGQKGRAGSISTIVDRMGLSSAAVTAIKEQLPRTELLNETFRFDLAEFDSHVAYRSVELDNGGIMFAHNENFEDVFQSEPVRGSEKIRFTTEGKIVNQSTRKGL